MGKKEKTEVGTEVGKGVKKNPTQIWPYLYGIFFKSFSNFTPDTRPLRLLKMIYNTKRNWDKQSDSVNVRPYSSDYVGYLLPKKERKTRIFSRLAGKKFGHLALFFFLLLCCHTASLLITSGTHTGGVQ